MSEVAKMAVSRGLRETAVRFAGQARTVIVYVTKLLLSIAAPLAVTGWAQDSKTSSWLENESIRLGVDLSMGGAVTSLAGKADGRELVNNFDHGRQIREGLAKVTHEARHHGRHPRKRLV